MKNNLPNSPVRVLSSEAAELASEKSDSHDLQIFQTVVTPEMAERLLENNPKNRNISERHVSKLIREMEGGRWKLNGDAIRISNGILLDGQHRLEAARRSKMPFESLVIVGLDAGVFDTIDAGRARTAGDALSINGEKNAARLAATLRFVNQYQIGKAASRGNYSTTEVEEILHKYPKVRDSVQRTADLAADSRLPIPFAICAGLHFLFLEKDKDLADKVLEQLVKGGTTQSSSPFDNIASNPIHLVRERHIQAGLKGQRIAPEVSAALVIKAWNALRRNDTSGKAITYRRGGDNPETFPEIQ